MKQVTRLLLFSILVTSCGKQGKAGKSGLNGAAGISAAVIAVKFCPNLVDQYGTQYTEHGFCIANKVYAVYWAHNQAFMTELTNGRYTTTTPYGNCSFTVSNNCSVTP